LPRKSRCFVRSQGGGMRRYAYELQLHHARLVQPIQVSSRTPSLLFTIVDSSLLSSLHSLSTIPTPTFFLTFKHATPTMTALRSSKMLLRRFARPAPPAFRLQPLTTPLQRRGLASHQDVTYPQVPYEKAENVGEKKFSQFDLAGKVFVVTGAACRPPPISRAVAMLSWSMLTCQQVEAVVWDYAWPKGL
jgi:hypothetical protein